VWPYSNPLPQPPGPQPGFPQPPHSPEAIGKLDEALTGAAGTLNCLAKRELPHSLHLGSSPGRTNNSKAAPQASQWYS
jgi:hypothetical protein